MVDIYILVEVGNREYESRLLLAKALKKKGFNVILGSKHHIIDGLILSMASYGIIFDKCGTWSKNWRIKTLRNRGFKYVVLDEEGIFTTAQAMLDRISSEIDLYLFNNKKHLNSIKKLGIPITLSQKNIVGNIRLSKALIPQQKPEKNSVLVIGSFDKSSKLTEYAYLQMATNEKTNAHFAKKIIEKISITNLVTYRPHPADGKNLIEELKKFCKISDTKSLQADIAEHEMIMNSGCTTSIEAYRQKKKLLTFGVPYHITSTMNGLGHYCRTINQAIELISKGFERKKTRRTELIFNRYCPNWGYPEKKIVAKINDLTISKYKSGSHGVFVRYLLLRCICFFLSVIYRIIYRENYAYMKAKFKDYPLIKKI